jgi:hypothetical protein
LKESSSGRVSSYGLIVLLLHREGMSERDPSRTKTRVHQASLPKVPPRITPLLARVVPEPDGVPADGIVGIAICELMGEEEEC